MFMEETSTCRGQTNPKASPPIEGKGFRQLAHGWGQPSPALHLITQQSYMFNLLEAKCRAL